MITLKRLCFITTIYTTLNTFVLETAKKLYSTGKYDITFICCDDEKVREAFPDYIHFVPVHMERGINLAGFKAIIEMVKILKRENFDYIQYSTPNASFYASIAAFLAHSPIRVYGQWGIRYVGANGIGRTILKSLEKTTCLLSTHIRPVSKKNMQFAIEEGLYKSNKSHVIGNGGTIGVNLKEFNIANKETQKSEVLKQYNIDENAFIFGFVGRLSKDKGSIELLKAFRRITDNGYDCKLFVVGNNEFKDTSDQIILWAQQNPNVIFAGRHPKSELSKFYATFDCYVHPTYREGFGMVLQEAGAMGNAIITTNIPGASEVMEKDISCILVEPRDFEDLYCAMEYAVKNPEITANIGRQAYKRTVALYERSIMINNIIEDIEKILKERD